MNLPSCFVPISDTLHLRWLITLNSSTYPGWREQQPQATQAWLDAHCFNASAGSFLLLPNIEGAPNQVAVGICDAEDPLALAHLPKLLPVGVYVLSPNSPTPVDSRLAQLGWGLGAYRFTRYLKAPKPLAQLAVDSTVIDAETFCLLAASVLVRDMVNTPTEHMGPDEIEAIAKTLADTHGATFSVIGGEQLLENNFPTIHAVGRASHRAPRLIELNWGNPEHPHIVIVGKGVCFDTGGLDLKPADGMRHMKKDMGGAAHALALAQLVMGRNLPVALTLLVPAVENAIAANAFRPGEVIVTRQGLSVEIDNTDAEGRLILCDALTYAAEKKPALILDYATLTGAARIALGPDLPALFCNDETTAADYLRAGERVRDRLWRMPLWRPYLSYLNSNIADLANAGASRMGGCITAALYLERFVPQTQPWAHIDVYAWNDGDRPGKPAGGEAQGLRAAFMFLQARFA